MTTAEKTKQVLFVCPSAYELTLVPESEDFREVDGRGIKIKPHRIHFRKKGFGGAFRGEFLASNERDIEFIRNHEWFSREPLPNQEDQIIVENGKVVMTKGVSLGTTRKIYEVDYNPEELRESPNIVHRRGDPIEPETEPPQETAPKPLRAKIAKKINNQ